MSKFLRSQKAHERLQKRYKNTGKDIDWIKSSYHACCYAKQNEMGRLLTQEEKEKIYKSTEYYFFN